jgi:hypothetical protein
MERQQNIRQASLRTVVADNHFWGAEVIRDTPDGQAGIYSVASDSDNSHYCICATGHSCPIHVK